MQYNRAGEAELIVFSPFFGRKRMIKSPFFSRDHKRNGLEPIYNEKWPAKILCLGGKCAMSGKFNFPILSFSFQKIYVHSETLVT